jgi:YggT family protein
LKSIQRISLIEQINLIELAHRVVIVGRRPQQTSDNPAMTALIILIDQIISLYVYTLFAYVIISWLVALRIVNPWQPFVRMATNFLGRIHEPLLSRFMPDLGGIDISPVILLLAAEFLRNIINGLAG